MLSMSSSSFKSSRRSKSKAEDKVDTPRDIAGREAIHDYLDIERTFEKVVQTGDANMIEEFIAETKEKANMVQLGYLKVICFRSFYLWADMKLEIDGRADGSRKYEKGFLGLNKGIVQVPSAHYESSFMPFYNYDDRERQYLDFTDEARRLVQKGDDTSEVFSEAETIKKISQTSDENLAKFSAELFPKARMYYVIKDSVAPNKLYRGLENELGFEGFI